MKKMLILSLLVMILSSCMQETYEEEIIVYDGCGAFK